jgi:Kef-type K+ transport system membrane component KefB/nucleotide-binding universal stress UspA family protein
VPNLELSALTTLLFQIAAIIIASRLLAIVMRRLDQPLVIAEVIAGIALGPSVFGALWPEGMTTLFPQPSFELLKMLSQIGLVLYMFLVGLELDPKLLRGRTHTSILISHTSIVVPFSLGAATGLWMYDSYAAHGVGTTGFVLFLGISMSVTAFPVLARILSERNLMSSQVGAIAIACAAVDDVTAWCLLAFVVAVARAHAVTEALWTTGFALAYIGLMVFVVRPFLRRLAERVGERSGLTPDMMAIILVMLIASASITEVIGIHALFGAFLLGAILPKDGRFAEMLVDKLESVAVVLLLPLFFAFSGLRTQIGLVDGAQDWLVTLGLVIVASVGKFGGSAVAARITGLPWREASAIGILLNTRGLMELIVLNIGLDLGVISPTVFTMLVIVALVTTFATTPLLRWVYPEHTRMHVAASRESLQLVERGAPFTPLICLADDKSGHGMVTLASGLVPRGAEGARAYALHLSPSTDRPATERRRRETNEQAAPLLVAQLRANEVQLDLRTLEFVSTEPGLDICRTAEAKQASMILLGWHRPLLLEGVLGGTVKKVLAHARRPVGVLVDRGLEQLGRVLVAVAGNADDAAVRQVARQLGAASSAEVTVMESASEDAVLAAAASGYDLVVVGVSRERVLSDAGISVLAVHAPREAAS